MDTSNHKLRDFRSLMHSKNIHAYMISNTDPHMSEYVPKRWTGRSWLSGFTGSAGLLVITAQKAGLWTDSRYFIQAEKELQGSEISLFKMGTKDTPNPYQWLASELNAGENAGFDGTCFSIGETRKLKHHFGNAGIHLIEKYDLLHEIWKNRPDFPKGEIFEHELKYAGRTRGDKLEMIRKEMREQDCSHHFIASLDDIAWLFNLRGNDIKYNPLPLAYAIIEEKTACVYLNLENISEELKNSFHESDVEFADYEQIFEDLEQIPASANVLLDPNRTNLNAFNSISANIVECENPTQILKSRKNEVEINGMKKAMLKDGVALTNFYCWLEENLGKIKMTEFSLIEKLRAFRLEQEAFKGESFETICAYNEHGASPHYHTTNESNAEIKPNGILLIDSGGQYLDGTTDITRTIALGELSKQQKTDYTLVLKGMIQLTMAVFPRGTRGCNLDVLARTNLWKNLLNYGHGTGHGVGCFMNVHEGPQSIRQELKDQAIEQGMITSNEPALYRTGKYGIRHENLILCKEAGESEFGKFLKFETISLCYFDIRGIFVELLNIEEKEWLNHYHQKVYELLAPELQYKQKEWLRNKTKAI